MNQDLSRFYAPNSDFYSEIQELTQILLRISEEKIGGWSLCSIDTFIATLSVLYAVKPHLLFLDPVSALLHTFPPDVLHLLPPTFKPGDHTNVLKKAQLSVHLTNVVINHNYILLHTYSNRTPINRPGSNTGCSSFLSKSSW